MHCGQTIHEENIQFTESGTSLSKTAEYTDTNGRNGWHKRD
jgi:hypothetical protein